MSLISCPTCVRLYAHFSNRAEYLAALEAESQLAGKEAAEDDSYDAVEARTLARVRRYLENVAGGDAGGDVAPKPGRKRDRPGGDAAGSPGDGSRVRRAKSSRYRGVSTKASGGYQARVQPAPREPQMDLGQYRLEVAAALAYDAGCAELGRAAALTNFGSREEYERALAEEAARVYGSDAAEPEGLTYDSVVARVRAKVARKTGGKGEGGDPVGAAGPIVPAADGAAPAQPRVEAEAPPVGPPGGSARDPPPGGGDPEPAGQIAQEGPEGGNGAAEVPSDGALLDSSQFGVGDFVGQQEPDGGENPVKIVEVVEI